MTFHEEQVKRAQGFMCTVHEDGCPDDCLEGITIRNVITGYGQALRDDQLERMQEVVDAGGSNAGLIGARFMFTEVLGIPKKGE